MIEKNQTPQTFFFQNCVRLGTLTTFLLKISKVLFSLIKKILKFISDLDKKLGRCRKHESRKRLSVETSEI